MIRNWIQVHKKHLDIKLFFFFFTNNTRRQIHSLPLQPLLIQWNYTRDNFSHVSSGFFWNHISNKCTFAEIYYVTMKGIDTVNLCCSLVYNLYIWNLEEIECKPAKEKCNYCGQSDYFLLTSSIVYRRDSLSCSHFSELCWDDHISCKWINRKILLEIWSQNEPYVCL